jgi:hypothetical protein
MSTDTRTPRWRPLLGARGVTKGTTQEARRASILAWARGRNEARRRKKKTTKSK